MEKKELSRAWGKLLSDLTPVPIDDAGVREAMEALHPQPEVYPDFPDEGGLAGGPGLACTEDDMLWAWSHIAKGKWGWRRRRARMQSSTRCAWG